MCVCKERGEQLTKAGRRGKFRVSCLNLPHSSPLWQLGTNYSPPRNTWFFCGLTVCLNFTLFSLNSLRSPRWNTKLTQTHPAYSLADAATAEKSCQAPFLLLSDAAGTLPCLGSLLTRLWIRPDRVPVHSGSAESETRELCKAEG